MASHRFSIPASVGLEIACAVLADRTWCCCVTTVQAELGDREGGFAVRRHGRRYKELLPARGSERSIVMRGWDGGLNIDEQECSYTGFRSSRQLPMGHLNVSSQSNVYSVAVLTLHSLLWENHD